MYNFNFCKISPSYFQAFPELVREADLKNKVILRSLYKITITVLFLLRATCMITPTLDNIHSTFFLAVHVLTEA